MSYSVLLNLENKNILVVGAGKIATRKIKTLLSEKALVYVVSNTCSKEINNFIKNGDVKYLGKIFEKKYLENKFLVFCATDDKKLNKKIVKICDEKSILVNDVSDKRNSSFTNMVSYEKKEVVYSLSTKGKRPGKSKKMLMEMLND